MKNTVPNRYKRTLCSAFCLILVISSLLVPVGATEVEGIADSYFTSDFAGANPLTSIQIQAGKSVTVYLWPGLLGQQRYSFTAWCQNWSKVSVTSFSGKVVSGGWYIWERTAETDGSPSRPVAITIRNNDTVARGVTFGQAFSYSGAYQTTVSSASYAWGDPQYYASGWITVPAVNVKGWPVDGLEQALLPPSGYLGGSVRWSLTLKLGNYIGRGTVSFDVLVPDFTMDCSLPFIRDGNHVTINMLGGGSGVVDIWFYVNPTYDNVNKANVASFGISAPYFTSFRAVDGVVPWWRSTLNSIKATLSNLLSNLGSWFGSLQNTLSTKFGELGAKLDELLGDDGNADDAIASQDKINADTNAAISAAVDKWDAELPELQQGTTSSMSYAYDALVFAGGLAQRIFNSLGWWRLMYFLVGLLGIYFFLLSKSGLAKHVRRLE